jgi:hypothetical protein
VPFITKTERTIATAELLARGALSTLRLFIDCRRIARAPRVINQLLTGRTLVVTSNRIGPTRARTPEWDHAWQLVCRLASARRDILDVPIEKTVESTRQPVAIPRLAEPISNAAAVDREEFARAVAEIEQASAALRQAEPALETGAKPRTKKAASRRPHSVWLLIATLWLSTALVIAGAVTAIAYFIH